MESGQDICAEAVNDGAEETVSGNLAGYHW